MPSMWREFGTPLLITSLYGLAIALLINLGFTSRLKCDWDHDATCFEKIGQDTQYYLSNSEETWWEVAFILIILLPITTAPYMLVECLKTYRVRYSDRFGSLADEAIFYLNYGRYTLIPAMPFLVLASADTGSISKGEDSGEDVVFVYTPFKHGAAGLHCKKSILNFDVVGPGVRLSTYVLLIFTVLSLTVGSLHARALGTKELGTCTLLNLFGTAFNVIKLKKNSLSPTEMFVALALIDAQIVSLVATLSSKDALASRWYVRLTIACVITAWVSVAVLGHGLKNTESYIKDSIYCVSMHNRSSCWPFETRYCDFSMYLAMIFPYYWYSHGFDLAHTLWLAWHHTTIFDSLEKLSKKDDHLESANTKIFDSLPATAFSTWRTSICHPFLVIIAIERHLAAVNQTNLAEWQAWGQSLTLCVCIGGLSHWFYVNRDLTLYILTWGHYGAWPSTQFMLPTDIVRSVAMDLEKPYLDREDRHLLATGHLSIMEHQSDDNVTLSETSEPPEALRPTIAHLKSADIIDQYLLGKAETFEAEKTSRLSPSAQDVCVNVAGD